MKKLLILLGLVPMLGLMPGTASALSLNFDFDHDGVYDTEWTLEAPPPGGNTVHVQIWLDDWDTSPWSSEPLFGAKIFFYYDDTSIKVNAATPHDTDNGGPFDSAFSVVNDLGGGKYQIEVAHFSCVSITDKMLLVTIELECISAGDVVIKASPTGGAVTPGGPSCGAPHAEGADDGTATIHQESSTPVTSTTSTGPSSTTSIPDTTTTSSPITITTTSPSTTSSTANSTTTTTPRCAMKKIYGDNARETQLLRNFRKNALSKNQVGQELITLYYEWSPAIVKAMQEDEGFRKDITALINEMVQLMYSQVE